MGHQDGRHLSTTQAALRESWAAQGKGENRHCRLTWQMEPTEKGSLATLILLIAGHKSSSMTPGSHSHGPKATPQSISFGIRTVSGDKD